MTHRTSAEIADWLVQYLAALLGVRAAAIDVTAPFDDLGLDSSSAIGLTGDLEDWLGRPIDPELIYDRPTIQAISVALSEQR